MAFDSKIDERIERHHRHAFTAQLVSHISERRLPDIHGIITRRVPGEVARIIQRAAVSAGEDDVTCPKVLREVHCHMERGRADY